MNILILGDSGSVFIKNYCTRVLTREDNVCILSNTDSGKYSDIYRQMGIKEIYLTPYLENSWLTMTNIVPMLYKKTRAIRKLLPFNRCDVIHVHYVIPGLLVYLFIFWITSRRRILTFWGSDILRISDEDRRLLAPLMHMATSLVFMIPNQYRIFQDTYGNRFHRKIRIIDFGNELLDIIDNIRSDYSKPECKREFGLLNDKVIIHVGYNKDAEQQHMQILEQICALPKGIVDKIQLVFPWAYGGGFSDADEEKEYVANMEKLLASSGVSYVFVTDFLQNERLAKFRMTCDILAYAQTTDAMSDSVTEYVYSGAFFLCPDWLWDNYSLINGYADRCIRYEHFGDLRDILSRVIGNWDKSYSKCESNEIRQTIYENKSWNKLIDRWRECYE